MLGKIKVMRAQALSLKADVYGCIMRRLEEVPHGRLTQHFGFFEELIHRDLLFDERDPTYSSNTFLTEAVPPCEPKHVSST